MKQKNPLVLRAVGAGLACALLAGCGGEKLAPSSTAAVSVSQAASASEVAAEEQHTGPLTTDTAAQGALTLTENSYPLTSFDHFGAFVNGYAFVVLGDEVGYLSEASGEVTGVYTIPEDDIFTIDLNDLPARYDPNAEFPGTRRAEFAWIAEHFACSESGVVPYYEDGLWGYCDLEGNVLVQPIYNQVSPFGKVAMGRRYEEMAPAASAANSTGLNQSNTAGNTRQTVYDIIGADGSVLASTPNGWVDPDLGYYMVDNEVFGKDSATLYNADGTVVLADVPFGVGNSPSPSCSCWQDGVILDGVAYDRTGAVIGDGSGKEVQGIGFGGLLLFHDDAGYGVLYPDGTEAVPASLSGINGMAEDGSAFARQKDTGAIRRYDAQLNELPAGPLARAGVGESYADEEQNAIVTPVTLYDQDGREITTLKSTMTGTPAYTLTTVLEEGDWLYFFPDNATAQAYQLTLAQ